MKTDRAVLSGSGERKPLPFVIDKTSSVSLPDQFVEGVRSAIGSGYYRTGDRLPTWRGLSQTLGVSERIPREAMARLVREGLVVSHRRIGCVIATNVVRRSWKGTVLAIQDVASAASFSSISAEMRLSRALSRAGYALVPLTIEWPTPRKAQATFSLIEHIMSFKADFVLMLWDSPSFARWLSRKGVPFAGYSAYGVPNCVGTLPWFSFSKAITSFVHQCQRAGVRRVLQVYHVAPELFDALPALRAAGIVTERWRVPLLDKLPSHVRIASERAFTSRLQKGRDWLPDCMLFVDDYLAQGALMAMAYAGIRVPEEMRIVSFVNQGNEIAFPVAPSVIQADSGDHGEKIAAMVVKYLRTGQWPKNALTDAIYRPGRSFPA